MPGFAGPSPEEKGRILELSCAFRFSFGEAGTKRLERLILNRIDEVPSRTLDFRRGVLHLSHLTLFGGKTMMG